MANHPHRGGLSRNALELIASFAAGGIALSRPQQYAAGQVCRAALVVKRLAEAQCNGHPAAHHRTIGREEWEAWEVALKRRHEMAERRIAQAIAELPHVLTALIGGDPRGATVKLVMDQAHKELHDDWGRDGLCVPGS